MGLLRVERSCRRGRAYIYNGTMILAEASIGYTDELEDIVKRVNGYGKLEEENKQMREALKVKMFADEEAARAIALNRDLVHAISIIKTMFTGYPDFEKLPHNLKTAIQLGIDILEGNEYPRCKDKEKVEIEELKRVKKELIDALVKEMDTDELIEKYGHLLPL